MAGNISDEAFARAVHQMGAATLDQIEQAKAVQAENAQKGILVSMGDVLVQQGIIPPAMRENVEKKLQAQAAGGIKQLGPYTLLKKLGEGGMGTVFLAEDTHVGRQVALKVLPKKFADNADLVSRFRREAKAAGALNHVNIVSAHNTGEDQGFHYLAMEYCEGESLEQTLKRDGSVLCDKALEIMMQVARGLQHAHEHGFVHRDIKPANIMLCKPLGDEGSGPEVAKILDLGLSKDMRGGEQSFATQTGVAMGTPHYISPEQARGDKNIDGRTDIYSLGATFYHLVTGMTPFEGSTGAVIMLKHLNEQLTNPQDVNETIPDGVAHVIVRMMAKEPDDRYANCKELLADLELVIDGKMPSSHAIEVGKSSVAVRMRVPRSGGVKGRTKGPLSPVGTRQHAPVGGAGVPVRPRRSGASEPVRDEVGMEASPASKRNLYIAAGIGVLVVLVLVIGLLVSSGNHSSEQQAAMRAAEEKRKTEEAENARLASEKKAEEARLKNEAARLEDDKRKLADEKRKAEEANLEEEKRKLAEERRKLEEAQRVAEAEAKKKAEAAVAAPKVEPTPVQPETKTATPDPKIAAQAAADAKAAKAQQLFSAVLKDTAPLLLQNKYADALTVLERKAKDPALADAAELLKQEKADIESVVELRRSAIEALRKMVGQQVTLKKTFNGKVVNDPKPDVVTLDMGGAQTTLTALDLSLDDVDKYGPSTGNVGADLRLRGIMYFAAGNVAKAKEYFTKPQTLNPEPYLDRITALELGEIEAAAQKAWEKAEKLFAAKNMNGAKAAYEAFGSAHGKTKTAAGKAALLAERYEAIEAAIGPAKEIVLDLGGGVKMEMVLVKAGEFDMGSNDGEVNEKPVHKVKISKPFYMGKYDVRVAEFRAFADAAKFQTEAEKAGKGYTFSDGKWQDVPGASWRNPGFSDFKQEDNYPVVIVSWNDAQEFCKWGTKATGRAVRLPTEAEWEYACRAGTSTKYYSGDKEEDVKRIAWYNANSNNTAHPVGQKEPNKFGLYDMAGNVWQWCQDGFDDKYYSESPALDPQGPANGGARVLRGGCWLDGSGYCRSARRYSYYPGSRNANIGFRVVVVCGSSRTP